MSKMKHAYLILAHSDKPLLERLVAMLDDERNDIYIHIDKKSLELSDVSFKTKYSNVYICPRRIKIYWGDKSQIEAELELLVKSYSRGVYDYYHIISGSDLPIKSKKYIFHFFQINKGKEFISYWNIPDAIFDARYKVLNYHFGMRFEKIKYRYLSIFIAKARNVLTNIFLFLKGSRPFPWSIRKGANWMSLTHDCVGYILQHQEQIRKHFRYTRCGDEIFIQSLLWDSPFRDRIYVPDKDRSAQGYLDDAALREIYWSKGAHSPNVWRMQDLDKLLSSPNLFARKFSTSVDPDIIEEIYNRFASSSTTE